MSPTLMSRIESAMRAVLEYNKAINRQDFPGLMKLIDDGCIFETTSPAPDGVALVGKKAIIQFWQKLFQKSPHAQVKIEDIFGFGDRCIMQWQYHWIDSNEIQRYVRGVDIVKVEDGIIFEISSYIKGPVE